MSAGFWLEGALSPDNGNASGLTFQRRSTISLMGGFGEVRLGRDYTPTFWNHTVYDPFGTNGIASSVTNYATPAGAVSATVVRSDNTIAYFTPNTLGGFFAQVQYGIKETNAASSASDYAGVRVGYAAGPLSIAVATAQEGCAAPVAPATVGANCGIDNPTRTNIGASYDLGVAKPMFQYTVSDQDTQGQLTNMLFGVTAPLGAVLLKASYVITNAENAAGTDLGDAKMFGIGADYNLSKRTALYGTYSRTSVDAGSPFTKKRGFEVGVRHSF
jgi:predicted porin